MSDAARCLHYTYEDYLQLEAHSLIRHEYWHGEIYAMAGGTPDHSALAATVIGVLQNRLPRGCRVFTSDLRVHIPATGLSTYPDASVVCGPTQRAAIDPLAVTNPILLIEVTSPSTEDYDRGEKLRNYQQLSSLNAVLFVSHREPRLTLHHRTEQGTWIVVEARSGEDLKLELLRGTLAVDDVYRDELEDIPQ